MKDRPLGLLALLWISTSFEFLGAVLFGKALANLMGMGWLGVAGMSLLAVLIFPVRSLRKTLEKIKTDTAPAKEN